MSVMERARALGRQAAGWKATGSGEYLGLSVDYTVGMGSGGAFAFQAAGEIKAGWGSDGAQGWLRDSSGLTRMMEAGELALARTVAVVVSSRWALAEAPVAVVGFDEGTPGRPAVLLDPGAGVAAARLTLDEASGRPLELACQRPFGLETWRFLGTHPGAPVPQRIEQVLPGQVTNWIELTDLVLDADVTRLCAVPTAQPADTEWQASSAEVPASRAPSGFVLVEARVNGRDGGAFVIDSGAAVSVITPKAAADCGLARMGHAWGSYQAGSRPAPRWRARRFTVGPLTIADPWFTEMDLSLLAKACGAEVAGVFGYDVFARAVVELELARPRLVLHDPHGRGPSEAAWQPLSLYSNRPHVRASFGRPGGGDGDGLFRLDTGASGAAVVFNSPIVARLALAGTPGMASTTLPLPGGPVAAEVGPLPWLELGGRRFERQRAVLVVGAGGTGFGDSACDGNIGQSVLAGFRMVLDYPRRRIALLPAPSDGSGPTVP